MRAQIGFQEYAAKIVAQERQDLRHAFLESTDYAAGNLEVHGSGLRNVVEWMETRAEFPALRVIFEQGLEDAVRLLNSIDAHTEAIELLFRSGRGHTPAASTLLRAVHEAVVVLCYLYDSEVPPAQSVARLAAYKIDSVQGNESTLAEFGRDASPKDLKRVQESTDGIKAFFAENGFVLGATKEPSRLCPSVSFEGERAQVRLKTTELAKTYLPDETYGWVIASGAVHSKPWFLPSTVDGFTEDAMAHPDESAATVLFSLLYAAGVLANTLRAHSGFDTTSAERRAFTRLKAAVARLDGTPFSPIDLETYKARGKSSAQRPPDGHVGAGLIRPGREYGLL
ncbi:hypothetical protein [Leifsonia shinshuensis]|uniref:Uncharacterized protein n=1 Tax=Leifsonia shinshuensis TaxID=150026 RepID=A0A7G6Y750_9MICO|nr:hypothetical protein [Leifsonia shinshuensis]QNE34315.1 hypothetical protein F1C12_03610 [Leifsonia shinshuensis]